jgi:hypothetical protein
MNDINKELLVSQTTHVLAERNLTSDICLVALGGSHAYGLATETSDVDVRGFALPTARDVLLGHDFEQLQTNKEIDLCIYSLAKTAHLMAQCNPNVIEMLGLTHDAILFESDIYRTMRDHLEWFLSRRAITSFGGYASAQLRLIQNAMARDKNVSERAKGEMRSLESTIAALPSHYPALEGATFALCDKADDEGVRINITMHVDSAPMTELASFFRQLDSARKSAETIGKNRRPTSKKLAKRVSHLIRLLHMGSEILRGEGVRTRRTDDAQLLLELKHGMWLNEDENGRRTYDDAFWDLLAESEAAFKDAKINTGLPAEPDIEAIDDFIADCHRQLIRV